MLVIIIGQVVFSFECFDLLLLYRVSVLFLLSLGIYWI